MRSGWLRRIRRELQYLDALVFFVSSTILLVCKYVAEKKRVGCKLQAAAAPAPQAPNVPPVDPGGWPGYQGAGQDISWRILFISIFAQLMSLREAL